MDLIALLSRFALFSLRLKLIFQVRLGFLALYFDLRWVLLFLLRKKRLRIKFYHYAAHSYIHHVHSFFFFFSCRYHHGNATDNQVNMENTRWKEMKSSRDLLLSDFVITCCQVFRYNHRCIWFWLFVFTSLLGSRKPSSSQWSIREYLRKRGNVSYSIVAIKKRSTKQKTSNELWVYVH